ncbi:DMT family transporter [Desulfosoma caldarium]|uniref:Drug/metabolite transporter (DMT)-like permease n=1 Tax=Desulfosoma caldarium TaxID=610254 RepID=A0A3N1VIM4_9BACT|nr:DMT family transporter [Desulfosoma caldarium]ROR01750.1 drug/metabolite transporter (DMT)-like permease [Desulfosoma caldarium]
MHDDASPALWKLWSIVSVGILAISSASILIRLAEAPSLAIAAYRVSLAASCVAPWALGRFSKPKTTFVIPWKAVVVSGCFLALHFAFWIESLKRTTVASSVTLVSTSPVYTAVFSSLLLRERIGLLMWTAITTCVIGSAVVAGLDFRLDADALLGDLLALLGGVMASGYFLAGRYARATLPLSLYISLSYGIAGAVLVVLCLISQIPLVGFSPKTYVILVLLAAVPQMIGHTSLNWALKHVTATAVAVLTLGEPLGASILAFFVFRETVSLPTALGLALLAAGIVASGFAASRRSTKAPRSSPP